MILRQKETRGMGSYRAVSSVSSCSVNGPAHTKVLSWGFHEVLKGKLGYDLFLAILTSTELWFLFAFNFCKM